jgi:TolB protein
LVLPGVALDSVRAILGRDLDYSDRFELLSVGNDPASSGPVNYGLYAALGAQYGVEVVAEGARVNFRLHDFARAEVTNEQPFTFSPFDSPQFRMEVHRAADEVVRWVTGTPGIAASRLLFVGAGRLYRIDSDGGDLTALTSSQEQALSPVWAPNGTTFAYTRFDEGRGSILIRSLAGGAPMTVPSTTADLNYAAAFAPDGRSLAFTRSGESGTDIHVVNIADRCCVRRLTVGRYADNLSPTYSPDGNRIAFVSTRAGPPQVYAMAADGTDQELLVPFDFGISGSSNGPEWSPDGASVAFHRDVDRRPQIFVMDVASRRARQLTSSGRNTDPTWAPDGRHIAFVSDRSGRRQLWIIDTETGRVRQLSTPTFTRLPAWSRRLVLTAAGSP